MPGLYHAVRANVCAMFIVGIFIKAAIKPPETWIAAIALLSILCFLFSGVGLSLRELSRIETRQEEARRA